MCFQQEANQLSGKIRKISLGKAPISETQSKEDNLHMQNGMAGRKHMYLISFCHSENL